MGERHDSWNRSWIEVGPADEAEIPMVVIGYGGHRVTVKTPEDLMDILEKGESFDSFALESFLAALEALKLPPEAINQRFESREDQTLLEVACRVDLSGQCVKELLRQDAKAEEPEGRNPYHGCTALHIAAENLNAAALHLLLEQSRQNRQSKMRNPAQSGNRVGYGGGDNALNRGGNNVLHLLCRHEDRERAAEILEELLKQCKKGTVLLDVNHINNSGQTPVFVAIKRRNERAVKLLLDHGCSIDRDEDLEGTARDRLQEWPQFPHPLPKKESFPRTLVWLLKSKEEGAFLERLPIEAEKDPDLLHRHDGNLTLLQRAVDQGLDRAVEKLLELGAHPDQALPGGQTASEMAASKGLPAILQQLIAKEAVLARPNTLSALHLVIKSAYSDLSRKPPRSEISDNYKQCFDQLLERKEILNARDVNKCTPLHLAASHRIPYFVDALVHNGACLGMRDRYGNTPMDDISPADLHKILNKRITLSDPSRPAKEVTLDIQCLKCVDEMETHKCQKNHDEMKHYDCQTLVLISKCEVRRYVLTHPLVDCLLHMKWKAISLFYKLFFLIYFIFAVLLGFRVYLDDNHSLENATLAENATMANGNNYDNTIYLQIINYSLWVVLTVITVLNVFYYWKSWDSLELVHRCLLKGVIVILTILILTGVCREHWCVVITNSAILLTSAEFVFLIGDHPKFTVYIKMLTMVTWNFLKFFVLFCPLLLAFVLCFAILFRKSSESLYNFGFWLFRVFVMITGEYEALELMDSTSKPVVSHVVFIMFVFFIALVLFNLLNALAVNDTIAINEDTRLYVNISRIKVLRRAEVVLTFLHSFFTSTCFCSNIARFIDEHIKTLLLAKFVNSKGKIVFQMNEKREWKSEFIVMDAEIIKNVENLKKLEDADQQDLLQEIMRKIKN